MPFLKPYNATDGGEHPDCYWALVQVNIGIADENAMVTYYGYHNPQFWKDGKRCIEGARKDYQIQGQVLDGLIAEHITPGGPNLLELIDAFAVSTEDTKSPTQEDPDRHVSFFNANVATRMNIVVTENGLSLVPWTA